MPLSLGIWRYSGVCPPWKPGRVPLPERDFWPRMPNPQLPPCSAQQLLLHLSGAHSLPAASQHQSWWLCCFARSPRVRVYDIPGFTGSFVALIVYTSLLQLNGLSVDASRTGSKERPHSAKPPTRPACMGCRTCPAPYPRPFLLFGRREPGCGARLCSRSRSSTSVSASATTARTVWGSALCRHVSVLGCSAMRAPLTKGEQDACARHARLRGRKYHP